MKLDHPEVLAKAVAQYFHDKEITNYIGEVYSVTVGEGSEKFEIVVTTQRVDAKSPHDLRLEAEAKVEELKQLCRDVVNSPDAVMVPLPLWQRLQHAAVCCAPTAEEEALLATGEYTFEELWGGREPTCPKCIGSKRRD